MADVTTKAFAQPRWMRPFFDVLPTVLRDEDLCRQEAAFLERWRVTMDAFLSRGGVPVDETRPLSTLCLALTHGLAVQRLVDPRGTPVQAVLGTWRELLDHEPATCHGLSGNT